MQIVGEPKTFLRYCNLHIQAGNLCVPPVDNRLKPFSSRSFECPSKPPSSNGYRTKNGTMMCGALMTAHRPSVQVFRVDKSNMHRKLPGVFQPELVTNAMKYGALSVPEGRVHVECSLKPNQDLLVHWTETEGPKVTPRCARASARAR